MKKILFGSLTILLIMTALTFSCGVSPQKRQFNEETWQNRIEKIDPRLLYAQHFKDGKYFNPWMPMENKSFFQVIRWRMTEAQKYTKFQEEYLPPVIPDALKRIEKLGKKDFILWVGHATFLLRINGEWWLTDPMFSHRALLPARKRPPGITLDAIVSLTGRINVVISHNHYDHLDSTSIEKLPPSARFFVPKGMGRFIRDRGKTDVHEMDWWEEKNAGDTKVTFLPAQHWSKRIFQGTNTVLWGSWHIKTPTLTVFFAGDSGYFIGYREFGKKLPPIDYALMPITAYHPRWFMHYAHMDITEAIRAFEDLGARYFIPTQWGTFHLGDNPPGLPALELKEAVSRRNPDAARFLILDIGGIHLPSPKQ